MIMTGHHHRTPATNTILNLILDTVAGTCAITSVMEASLPLERFRLYKKPIVSACQTSKRTMIHLGKETLSNHIMLPQVDITAVTSLCVILTFILLPRADRNAGLKWYSYLAIATLVNQSPQTQWTVVVPITITVGITTIIGTALFWLLQTAFFRRKWLPASDPGALQRNEWLGKPLLFPTKLSHSRMFPERYNYTYNYFLVGVPIGLRGRVGSVLSIDTAQPAPDDANKPTQSTKCWFKIDQRYYLEPGNHPQGLEGKLHRYLRSRVGLRAPSMPLKSLLTRRRVKTPSNGHTPT